jgi:hypothetical protein
VAPGERQLAARATVPIAGRKSKPEGQKRNRHQPVHDWTEVPDVPFRGGQKLPARQPGGAAWPARTKQWWSALSSMPHCALWSAPDWQYALDTAFVHARFAAGDMRAATELRNREKLLGNTLDGRRGLRIRYVSPVDEHEEPAGVASLDEYRAALS